VAAVAFCASQACQGDAPESTPGIGGTNAGGPEDTGNPDMGMIQARISPSGVIHVAQFGGASTVYRMNYVGNGQ
jgi:hypothetical protein